MMNICQYNFSKPSECTTPRVSPYVNYGFWVIVICQYTFIPGLRKKKYHLVSDVDHGGG